MGVQGRCSVQGLICADGVFIDFVLKYSTLKGTKRLDNSGPVCSAGTRASAGVLTQTPSKRDERPPETQRKCIACDGGGHGPAVCANRIKALPLPVTQRGAAAGLGSSQCSGQVQGLRRSAAPPSPGRTSRPPAVSTSALGGPTAQPVPGPRTSSSLQVKRAVRSRYVSLKQQVNSLDSLNIK